MGHLITFKNWQAWDFCQLLKEPSKHPPTAHYDDTGHHDTALHSLKDYPLTLPKTPWGTTAAVTPPSQMRKLRLRAASRCAHSCTTNPTWISTHAVLLQSPHSYAQWLTHLLPTNILWVLSAYQAFGHMPYKLTWHPSTPRGGITHTVDLTVTVTQSPSISLHTSSPPSAVILPKQPSHDNLVYKWGLPSREQASLGPFMSYWTLILKSQHLVYASMGSFVRLNHHVKGVDSEASLSGCEPELLPSCVTLHKPFTLSVSFTVKSE